MWNSTRFVSQQAIVSPRSNPAAANPLAAALTAVAYCAHVNATEPSSRRMATPCSAFSTALWKSSQIVEGSGAAMVPDASW
jgi:hypothetical protein